VTAGDKQAACSQHPDVQQKHAVCLHWFSFADSSRTDPAAGWLRVGKLPKCRCCPCFLSLQMLSNTAGQHCNRAQLCKHALLWHEHVRFVLDVMHPSMTVQAYTVETPHVWFDLYSTCRHTTVSLLKPTVKVCVHPPPIVVGPAAHNWGGS
jgi:hypothetical protein